MDDFLFVRDIVPVDVESPDGKKTTLYVRAITAAQEHKFNELRGGLNGSFQDDELSEMSVPFAMSTAGRSFLISRGWVQEDGKPAAGTIQKTYDKAEKLNPKYAKILFDKILEISGLKNHAEKLDGLLEIEKENF